MRWQERLAGAMMAVLVGAAASALQAQQCDDFNECTRNDMCSDGTCVGTSAAGESCDDFDDCTVNDHCVGVRGSILCRGDAPAPVGTECAGGCGTCQPLLPTGGGPVSCIAKADVAGQLCEFEGAAGIRVESLCVEAHCLVAPVPTGALAFCVPQAKVCPDTDGNPCTDACNVFTGECERNAPKCDPTCGACNPTTGACEPTNIGMPCDDFDDCTSESRCQNVEGRGVCVAGTPGEATPTPGRQTPTPTRGTPPPTPTLGPCVGDCDGDGSVRVNELIIGVNILLETAAAEQCRSFDTDGDNRVAVNELVEVSTRC